MSRRTALIIGNSLYLDPSLAQLRSPGADVRQLADALSATTIGAFDDVLTLVDDTEDRIRRELVRFFTNRKRDELLLLYFSGHGVRHSETGQLYLAVNNTELSLLSATAIPAAFITEQMDICRSQRQVLILDCCHSGAFVHGRKSTQSVGTADAFRGTGFGRVVLTASDATQYALEGERANPLGDVQPSVFTRYLVQGLATGEADLDKDGLISLDEWYDYAYEQVVSFTPNQTPGKWSFRQQGNLVIARNPKPQIAPAALPSELQQALDDDRPASRLAAVYNLGSLLRGTEPAITAAAVEALKRLTHDDSRAVASAATAALTEYESVAPKANLPEALGNVRPDPLRQSQDELARIIDVLNQPSVHLPYARDRLSGWRSQTAQHIRSVIGLEAALKLGTISAPANMRGEQQRLLHVAQQCRQYLDSLM